jgi:hypothetical protein
MTEHVIPCKCEFVGYIINISDEKIEFDNMIELNTNSDVNAHAFIDTETISIVYGKFCWEILKNDENKYELTCRGYAFNDNELQEYEKIFLVSIMDDIAKIYSL